jgi:uncharacterized protein YjhX (UPF0386 family)
VLLVPQNRRILMCPFRFGCRAMSNRREGKTVAKRTIHRSSKGTKLYAVRDRKGRFKDIQTYKRAHSADMRRKSTKEK